MENSEGICESLIRNLGSICGARYGEKLRRIFFGPCGKLRGYVCKPSMILVGYLRKKNLVHACLSFLNFVLTLWWSSLFIGGKR